MKTQKPTVQDIFPNMNPQHTQGEWKHNDVSFGTKPYKELINDSEKETIAEVYGNTREEAEANAQRIVKAVNEYDENKRKADMHDELIEHIRKLNDEFVYALTNMAKILKLNMSVESLRIEENTLVKKSKQLLKQAEGK